MKLLMLAKIIVDQPAHKLLEERVVQAEEMQTWMSLRHPKMMDATFGWNNNTIDILHKAVGVTW